MAPFGGSGQRGGGFGRGRGGMRGSGRGGRGGRGGLRGARNGGPKLPSDLMAEVDSTYGAPKNRNGRSMTRKEQRKADRQGRKQPSHQAYHDVSASEDEQSEDDQPAGPPPKLSKKAQGKRRADTEEEEKPKKKRKLPELTLPGAKEDDVEDQEIEWLEYMLRKEKEKAKDDDLDDGLDDILEFADIIGPGGKGLSKEDRVDDDDFDFGSEDDEASGDELSFGEQSDEETDGGEGGEDADGSIGSSEDDEDLGDDSASEGRNESEERSDDGEETDGEAEEWAGIDDSIPRSPSSEDAPAQAALAEPAKHIPPHLRAAALAEKAAGDEKKAEERRKLERKTQGLLNKLSEANIESILAEIENLYRDYSRNDMTTALTNLVLQMISNKANLLDSFVVLYATLVGSLHRIIGLEFGAHFVHILVTRYHKLFNDPSSAPTKVEANLYETPDAGKEALNLLTLIAELYNAGVIGSGLIYDLIRGFISASPDSDEIMGEKEVESLLKLLRCSGSQLRTDDPASLKDIVGLVQDKTKGKEKTMTTRARFMIETLVNVKNGKGKTGNGAEQSSAAAERMKKFLATLGRKRRLLASEPLRVSLNDLLAADKKGKWWLVGAGWSGNPLVEREQAQGALVVQKPKTETTGSTEEEALLDLARKQGMNTDVRRSIFVILLTSEDYMHACDRLNQLRFTAVQQREFIRVTLHCCALEKRYNPYYTLVLNNLCAESYDHRFTLQYALWDFLRELAEGSKETRRRGVNVAKAMAYLIARGSMDLTAFKAIEWTDLSSSTTSFLVTFLVHLVLSSQTVSPLFALPKGHNPDKLDVEGVEDIFEKSLSNGELAQGLAILLGTQLGPKKLDKAIEGLGLGEKEGAIVTSCLQSAREVLARAI
ncbi:osmoregulation-related protein [Papiliotrema laurentii]|uniref:Osmoregulation-related protein n=1 Tax=Papiliotrema laurentii TaxID=5418 RepID=A0AAD9FT91_PAPLA|nr:osmoregulation-related protein [Papiliotrema laurentii]